jgi:dinuclear metal center YbgI/SA1388 family protein
MTTVGDLQEYLEDFAPLHLAAEWDNVGLLLGDRNTAVERVLTCLTVSAEVAEEALAEKVQLLVAHHPILFRGTKRLNAGNPEGRMLLALIRADVAVYSPHTAFDNTRHGINDALAARLGLTNVRPLRRRDGPRQFKIVVFVPEKDGERVANAMFAAGAGRIGEYSQCSFRTGGTGTFFGSDTTNPTVGKKGRREEVGEWRLEAVCPEKEVESVLATIRQSHSYEEPAYDVYPLAPGVHPLGEGRVGKLARIMTLKKVAQTVKGQLNAGAVQIIGDAGRKVQTVAIVCGAGGEFLHDANRAHADVLLTGEMRFHDYLAAQAMHIGLVLPGHYATERPGVEELAKRLQQRFPDLRIWASRRECDPASWL